MTISVGVARLLGLAVILCLLASCEQATVPGSAAPEKPAGTEARVSDSDPGEPPDTAASAWDEFVTQYIEDFFAAHPAFAVFQGRHEYDGTLPDWSAEGIAREIARLKQAREDAQAFGEEELGEKGQYQRE